MPGKTSKKRAPARSTQASKTKKPIGAPTQDPPVIIKGGSMLIEFAPNMTLAVKGSTAQLLPDMAYKNIFFSDDGITWKPIGNGTGVFQIKFLP
jgi:hypothetical protein